MGVCIGTRRCSCYVSAGGKSSKIICMMIHTSSWLNCNSASITRKLLQYIEIDIERSNRIMTNALPDGLTKWHRFVSEKDMQALSEALADDILFRSPVLWKPKQGRATAMLYFSSAVRVLEDF